MISKPRCLVTIFVVIIGLAPTAQAEFVKFNFTASVDHMFEYDDITTLITSVGRSTFSGSLVSIGDTVTGVFKYDTNAPLSPYYQPPPPSTGTYDLYADFGINQGAVFTVGKAGPSYVSSNGIGAYTLVQVANNASAFSGWDIISVSNSAVYSATMFQNITLNLFDKSATVFSNSKIPSQLDLNSFHYANLDAGWLRKSDNNQFHFQASLTSLTSASPVPEPSTLLSSLVGYALTYFWFVSRSKYIFTKRPSRTGA